tara:strand:- start:22363 stop:22659 length:297 start_codon:yes stop_codon:yes gene_type:complete
MSSITLYLLGGIGLCVLGLHALLLQRNALRQIIAVNVMGSGVFMVMVALASRSTPTDPVLQALVVTGLVVAASATAFALRLAAPQRDRPPTATGRKRP